MVSSTKKPVLLFVVNVDWFFLSHRLPIALEAIKQGYDVHIAVTITSFRDQIERHGLTLHQLSLDRGATNPLSAFRTFCDILRICYRLKPDVIHFITIKPVIIGGIAAHLLGATKIVFSISGLGYIFSSSGIKSIIRRLSIAVCYRIALSHNHFKIIFQNQQDLFTVVKMAKIPCSKCILIPGSGVDLSEYFPAEPLPVQPIVLFPSRLLISKGIREFVRASQLVPGVRFVVAGQLDLENRDCIQRQELDNWVSHGIIEYHGYSERVADLINKSSIVVLPSYYGEGLPKVLIEAAACGRPIITTDHPGCRDAIEPGITGLLVPVRDAGALANAIRELLDNPDRRISMGLAGRALAERKFDIKQVVQTHLDIYAELIAENS